MKQELLNYQQSYLTPAESQKLFSTLLVDADWQRESITLFGKLQPVPRLTDWAGEEGVNYRYSGLTHPAKPWPLVLTQLRNRLSQTLTETFNFVLMNRYVDGRDSMGWHRDDEPGVGATIASISLGATRRFLVRPDNAARSTAFELTNGSLLVMSGSFQAHNRHALPKTKRSVGERINLTFRRLHHT